MLVLNWVLIGCIPLLFMGRPAALEIQWKAEMAKRPPALSQDWPVNLAKELSNGDFAITGINRDRDYVMRLDAKGNRLWLRDVPPEHIDGATWHPIESFVETEKGLVALRRFHKSVGEFPSELDAILYDAAGNIASQVGVGNGLYAFTRAGDVLSADNADHSLPHLRVQMRSFGPGVRWTETLGRCATDELAGILDRGEGNAVVACAPRTSAARDSLKLWALSSEGKVEWAAAIATAPKGNFPEPDQNIAGGFPFGPSASMRATR